MDPQQIVIPFQQGASSSKADADQASQVDAGCETSRVKFVKPIIYGNMAWYLGPQTDGRSHEWKVYLQAYDNEDLSVFVERVHFRLFDEYAEPVRVCESPPYEVTERSGREFEVLITIDYRDCNEPSVTFCHCLKLYDRDRAGIPRITNIPFRYESYNTLIFSEPTLKMHRLLSNPKFITTGMTEHEEQMQKLFELERKMNEELAEMQAELAETKKKIEKLQSRMES